MKPRTSLVSSLARRYRATNHAPLALAFTCLAAFLMVSLVLAPHAGAQDYVDPTEAVQARAVAQRSTVRPGDQLVIAVELSHDEGFHTWPNEPVVPPEFGADFPAIATTIDVTSMPDGAQLGEIQWPDPTPVTVYYTLAPVELLSYHDKVVAYVPVLLPADVQTGDAEVGIKIAWQSCDEETCYFPQERDLVVPLGVVAAGEAIDASANEPALFAGFDVAGFNVDTGAASPDQPDSKPDSTISFTVFGRDLSMDPTGPLGLGMLLLIAALGGALLNFTPCVLPVIPLKIMGLSQSAGNPRRLLLLGVAMSLGVVAFWLLLGGAISFVAGFDAISSLFQTGWFAIIVGLVVGVMALGMFGLWELTLPQSVYKVRADHDSYHGSFLFGIMTAVLSTPCTAPFMGAAAAWAATQDASVTMATFTAIGVGMALPYLLLSARPELLNRLPRSGPGSQVLKQFLGLIMIGVAMFFLGLGLSSAMQQPPEPPSRAYWWVVAFFIVAAFVWLAIKTVQLTKSTTKRAAAVVLAVVIAGGALLFVPSLTSHGPIEWTHYSPEAFAEAQAAGDVVVLDFTAEWCLNCRALEQGVLHQDEVADVLNGDGVVPMRVDLTGDNPDGKAKLQELEWVGIPLLAVYGLGLGYDNPVKYDTYTPSVVIKAIESARGGNPADGG